MKLAGLLQKNKLFLLLISIFIIAEIITNPLGNFPLNDDWAFAQAINNFYRTGGDVFLGNWPAMTMYTQIMYGYIFTKIFGLSCFVLRCSTIVSAIIGFAFLNKLIIQVSGHRAFAFLGCLVLLFNPLFFNMSNTFMTDVNFNTLVIICFYYMYNYFRTNKIIYYLCFLVFSTALVLLRQYGIIFPACFILAGFFAGEKKIRHIILGLISLIVVSVILKIYEDYLAISMPSGALFKFSGDFKLTERVFWDTLFSNLSSRYNKTILQILFYSTPFALIFLRGAIKQLSAKLILWILAADLLIIYLLFDAEAIDTRNVFINMRLGPELFYESFNYAIHNQYDRFETYMYFIKLLSSFITLFVLSMCMVRIIVSNTWRQMLKPGIVFFTAFIFAYSFMLMIPVVYHDRYHIPYITVMIILAAYLTKIYSVDMKLAVIPLLFWAYVSVAGTKDYLSMNRERWNAYWYLRTELKAPKSRINGGFEVNCWNEGEGWGWRDFLDLSHFDYIIQFNPEDNFKQIKEYEFQRYFPYKKDKIYIFAREAPKK